MNSVLCVVKSEQNEHIINLHLSHFGIEKSVKSLLSLNNHFLITTFCFQLTVQYFLC